MFIKKTNKIVFLLITIIFFGISLSLLSEKSLAGCGNGRDCTSNEVCELSCSSGYGQCYYNAFGVLLYCDSPTSACYLHCKGYGGGSADATYGPSCGAGTVIDYSRVIDTMCGLPWKDVVYVPGNAQRQGDCCQTGGGKRTCGDWYNCPTRNNPDKMCRDCEETEEFCAKSTWTTYACKATTPPCTYQACPTACGLGASQARNPDCSYRTCGPTASCCPAFQACPTACGLGESTAQNGNCTTRTCAPTAGCPRTISGNLYETSNPSVCNQSASLASSVASGLNVTAFDGTTQKGSTAGVSGNGTYSVSNLFSTDSISSLCVNGALDSATGSYQLSCVKASGITCIKGSGACAISCTPANALATTSPTLSFGFSLFGNDKWFDAIDGDIYGDGIIAYVASAPDPLAGFSPYLINTQSGSSIGGYGFSATTIDTQSTGSDVSEKGGSGQRLAVFPAYPPTDGWLNKFNFAIPSGAITSIPSNNSFEDGKVYSFSVSQFNSILNEGSYKFERGDSFAPAVAIVYVTGSGSININSDFVSKNNDKSLVVVTTAEINISKEAGTALNNYRVNGASQIDLIIIAKKDINFASQYNENASIFDKPLMIYGSLASMGTINMNRNLGFVSNASYPATSVRFYPYLMSLIARYELENNTTGEPYTGLATFDVQFNYGN